MAAPLYINVGKILVSLFLICGAGIGSASAQSNVGPNEQRFNAGVYKASHNSYQRDETLASQIDNWNCWCLELDLVWHTDNQIRVQHSCGDQNNSDLLSTRLSQVAASIEATERVTVIYLEMKGACASWPSRSAYRSYIRAAAESALGAGRIYPSIEFKQLDQFRWPSYQELLRRGYHWIIILDEEETGFADDNYFFGMARGNPAAAFEDNSVLINSGNPGVVPDRGMEPDRWLFRVYPLPFCGPFGEDPLYFVLGRDNAYTFVATNCIDHDYTMQPPTHSASPVRVTNSGSGAAFGTLAFPFREGSGLIAAIQRSSPRVPVQISAGVYQVPAGTRLDRPVVLHSQGGTTRIISP